MFRTNTIQVRGGIRGTLPQPIASDRMTLRNTSGLKPPIIKWFKFKRRKCGCVYIPYSKFLCAPKCATLQDICYIPLMKRYTAFGQWSSPMKGRVYHGMIPMSFRVIHDKFCSTKSAEKTNVYGMNGKTWLERIKVDTHETHPYLYYHLHMIMTSRCVMIGPRIELISAPSCNRIHLLHIHCS